MRQLAGTAIVPDRADRCAWGKRFRRRFAIRLIRGVRRRPPPRAIAPPGTYKQAARQSIAASAGLPSPAITPTPQAMYYINSPLPVRFWVSLDAPRAQRDKAATKEGNHGSTIPTQSRGQVRRKCPEGAQHLSPGHRPGSARPQHDKALQGRHDRKTGPPRRTHRTQRKEPPTRAYAGTDGVRGFHGLLIYAAMGSTRRGGRGGRGALGTGDGNRHREKTRNASEHESGRLTVCSPGKKANKNVKDLPAPVRRIHQEPSRFSIMALRRTRQCSSPGFKCDASLSAARAIRAKTLRTSSNSPPATVDNRSGVSSRTISSSTIPPDRSYQHSPFRAPLICVSKSRLFAAQCRQSALRPIIR